MSAVSGLNAKAEKGRSKYVALDINSIYKGKSLENPKATVQPKHGLQSLGKVGTGRRMPPPANLPSLKSENSGNNPNISLVPSGGSGWGSATKEKAKSATEETNGGQQPSPQSQPASSLSQTTPKTSTTNTVSTSGTNKTWSSVTSSQEDGGQERNFLGQQSPFFPQEFPKLAGGDAPTEGNQKSSADTQYGPGPSLRPQTEGSWGRGTLQQPQQSGTAGNQQQSAGSGVNGPQTSDAQSMPSQHLRDQRPYSTSRSGSGPSSMGVSAPPGPPIGTVPPMAHGPGSMSSQMGPGSAMHPPPQFRGMMPSFMFGRNTYPSGYPSNYTNVPPPPPQQGSRPQYPYSENRRPQPVRPLAEEEAYQRPAAIITEKALKGFDEILQNDTQDTWATSHGEIDYNAKLVFSDDEESPVNPKKEKRDGDEKSSKGHSSMKNDKERERKLERERSIPDRDRDNRPRDSDWSRDGRQEKKGDPDADWNMDRSDSFERERDERWKSWSQPPQGRSPSVGGMDMQRQWQTTQPPPQRPFDYRGPPPQAPAYATSHARMAAGPVPLMQHGSYPPPRQARPGPRSSSVTDDDEMWRQRRKQHTEEMAMTVERARQRRAEEEKHYEQSKQCAQEKAKNFEKSDKEKDSIDVEENERSRHSSESREDKPLSRDGRDRERDRERDRSQSSYQVYNFSKQFQKNVPPRFQKQAEYIRQQQTQQSVVVAAPQGSQVHFMRSQSVGQTAGPTPAPHPVSSVSPNAQPPLQMGVNYDSGWGSHPSSYVNQMPNISTNVSKGLSRQRSNSQGSGTDSYDESDGCPPENASYDRENYWGRERRQNISGFDNWHSPGSSEAYYDQKLDCTKLYDERHDFKRSQSQDKEEKPFDFESHPHDVDRREKDFEEPDYRYKSRDSFKESFKENPKSDSRDKEKVTKSSSWARDYDERLSDPFEDTHETGRDKHIPKDRPDRYERERWEKERPPRPDSRDSRASKESIKEERLNMERHETQSTQTDRERKSTSNREDKKEKNATLDWGDSPYPIEPKRREWHHHPPPITPKQFESIGPPKKNMTPLRRSNVSSSSQNIPEKKCENTKDETVPKKTDGDSSVKKEKEAKEEKNEKIKSETAKESEKHIDNKFEQPHFEKTKSFNKDIKKSDSDVVDLPKKDTSEDKEKHKWSEKLDKDKHEQSRSEQNRDRRRDGRERGGINSRSKGGNTAVSGNQPVGTNISNRYESSRGRGGSNTRSGSYGGNNVSSGNVNTGSSSYRGKKEYRRSRVERGPRFERQKEREKDKIKDDKKEKHSDDTSCSEVDDGKIGHLRQKDEDSEVSVDEASASTTESAQAEKYQGSENIQDDDKGFMLEQSNSLKDSSGKSEKYKKEKKDSKVEAKTYENEKVKDDKGGFAPRGEPSRRGRGGGTLSFRNSRGGSRHGPSSYGPPPSRAGFGGNKQEKSEEQKIVEEHSPESNQSEYKSNVPAVENANMFPKESNKSRSLERPQQRRSGRFTDTLPPRFQKRQDRRFEKFEHSYRGRGRGGRSGGYQGSGNQLMNKMGQGGKENLSDVANEEWETASESSDVAERRDRRDEKEDSRKKESREKGSSSSRKSFSSQRPVNESSQGRRGNESRRGGGQNNGDKNRQKDNFPRDTRPRDSGRSRQGNYNSDRRVVNSNGNSRPSSSAGHPSGVSGRNNGRSNPSSKTGAFQPKNEGTAAVYRVDEIKLQDPDGVQAALTDLTNRRTMKTEVTVNKVPKTEKEKSGGLEGYDLNNYASVVIIDDHPEVVDDTNLLCGTDDGFQEVTSKKRHKVMIENEVKKLKKEPHNRNKSGGSRSRQSRLPPRFAKQRENLVKAVSVNNVTPWDISVDLSSKSSNTKDASPAPPPSVNAWEKPITHSLRSHSPVVTSNTPATSITNTIVSSCSSVIPADVQVLASTSKSSSFDRSDQHDSGIDVSDQPASAASSQRSSPSNDCKIITPTSSGKSTNSNEVSDLVTEIDTCKPMCTVVFENKNFKAENAVLDKFGGQPKNQSLKDVTSSACEALPPVGASLSNKSKESTADTDEKSHCLPVTFPAKDSYGKGEENSEMKLEFTFESGLEQLSDEKGRNSASSGHLSSKSINISRSMDVSNTATTVGVQSPISPSADDLNLKIQSVKKVWENDPPLPTVMEHPQTVSEENSCPTSYGSFSGNSETAANVYNNADNNSQNRKEAETTEISFRENSPLQQSNSTLSKSIDHGVTSVKSHIQMAAQHNSMTGPHCAGPLSPPLMGGLEAMTGIRAITGLASSVQVAGIPAIPSPPTVLFNSSQQMAQTGMYQPLQMDSRQTPAAAAVAAAMVQFSQSPHGYAPLGTYGLSHQPPPNPQLSNAYGQQSLFVQPPAAHQGQDLYSSSQYRVQPPYPQSQHVSSNQVMSAQQNLNSHLLGSQLVQTRPAAGPSPAAPHFQSLNGLQAVQPTPQTSYFSTSAQPQTNFYHQTPATPGSPMQQQPQYPSHQSYGSQSALNVLPQTAAPNFRNYGSHQYKAPSSVMNNIVPEATSLRSATRSPTVEVPNNRNMFGVSTAVSTTLSSTPVVAVPPMSTSGVGKIGQTQANALSASRINSGSNKTSQYSLAQSQQHYYPFGQQKFGHVQSNTVRPPQVLFQNVVRNPPHQQLPAVATASNMHYPPPIQRPGPAAAVAQAATQPANPKIGIRPQASVLVPGGKLTSAQQAKLRAEAVQQTHMFFAQSKTGKHEESASSMITQEKGGLQSGSVQKLSLPNSSEEEKEKQSSTEASVSGDGKESFEGGDVNSVEE